MALDNVRAIRKAPGDSLFADDSEDRPAKPDHELDSADNRAEWRKLMAWLEEERELQSENRMEMAIDADMYDNFQWRPEDAAELEERNQMPLVFNEVAPMVDWMIGTERRTRVDAKVLPRAEDDVQMADTKTKVMKYMSDVNRSVYVRSEAFAESIKAGLSWVDDGVRDDPTKEAIYKEWESWRNVLHDSRGAAQAKDMSRCRYLFRWRYVDLDVAEATFEERAGVLRLAAEDSASFDLDAEGLEGFGAPLSTYMHGTERTSGGARFLGSGLALDGMGSSQVRKRVKIYEAQYRRPVKVKMVLDGPFRGSVVGDFDPVLGELVGAGRLTVAERLMMRMHVALFTTAGLIDMGPSPFRHNDFTLTPIWCYRRGRDGLPYGMIRRVRDLQLDLNKRASKANFLINSNQIIADDNATTDWETLRDEASRPDGVMAVKAGARFEIRRDGDQVAGQVEMMRLAAATIQKSGGVADENLGRQTNAVSGEAIKARQTQGSVVTTEPFDNLRLATQISGDKELSLIEQFLTEEKVVRLTGDKGRIEWLKLNQIEVDANGTVRILNDVTASKADFVVSEQDYAGTLRQVMFDSMMQIAQRLPPEVALRMMRIAYEFSDLPNKDEIVQELRSVTGEKDPEREPTPEEQAAEEAQMQAQQEALEVQREQIQLEMEERRAKVRELNAKSAKLESELGQSQGDAPAADALAQARAQAQDVIDRLQAQVSELSAKLAAALARNDDQAMAARIKADAEVRKAEILAAGDKRLQALEDRVNAIAAESAASPQGGTQPVSQPQPQPTGE